MQRSLSRTVMSSNPGYFVAALIAGGAAAASMAMTPIGAAEPVWPVGGGEPADATIQDLETQGYDVQINWVTGYPTVPLSECWVMRSTIPTLVPGKTSSRPSGSISGARVTAWTNRGRGPRAGARRWE